MVTSPNFPNDYPKLLDMTQMIQVEEGMLIEIEFTAFETEHSYESVYNYQSSYYEYNFGTLWCYDDFDHLKIEDGDGSSLMDKTCGSSNEEIISGDDGQSIGPELPPNRISKTNVVKFIFKSDDYDDEEYGVGGSRGGWSVSWRAVSPPGECQHQP